MMPGWVWPVIILQLWLVYAIYTVIKKLEQVETDVVSISKVIDSPEADMSVSMMKLQKK